MKRLDQFSTLKNYFENQNFEVFDEVIDDFGRSDDDMICEKMPIFHICRRGLMPNLIEKSWTVDTLEVLTLG